LDQNLLIAAVWFVVCMAGAWFLIRMLIPRLRRWGYVDRPNQRSSHAKPMLRGGGLAVVAMLIVPIGLNAWHLADRSLMSPALLLAALLGLTAISWRDDRKSLPVATRLAAQATAVALGLMALPSSALVFQGWLPPLADRLFAALIWIWFINLYNFMDGIDGITGAETAAIGLGLALISIVAGLPAPVASLGLAIAGAACGFLLWNWAPAKLFLGDVGSIPLGFIVGFALLYLAAAGQPAPAIMLPLYYLFDATTTLLRRIARREAVWRAHRSHAYQVAAAATSHRFVVWNIIALNVALTALALLAAWLVTNRLAVMTLTLIAVIAAGFLAWRFRTMAGETFHKSRTH
jgi:UDP-N-acetylmuramyl pentapeptide phosphotransferase/UDP-N-acetylglucosamine-1-phosphate transferase